MATEKKVLIGPSTFGDVDREPIERLRKAGYSIINNPYKRTISKQELVNFLSEGITGVIAGLEIYDREVLEKSKVKILSRSGSGLSNIDLNAAKDLGISVFSTPDGPINAVSELTIGCLLTLLRKIHIINNSVHEKKWEKLIGSELKGKVIAIIGYGKIGKRVGYLASAFGAKIIAVDPLYKGDGEDVTQMDLKSALKVADIITIHASGIEPILTKEEFLLMKPGMILLNAGRGELVDEVELINAVKDNIVAGVWLDTFKDEPYSGPLCDINEILLTSHIGSLTIECRKKMESDAVNNLICGFSEL